MRRRWPLLLLLLGLPLAVLGWRQQADWAGHGRIVAVTAQPVAGSPPWQLTVPVPVAGEQYLLELTVHLPAPPQREVVPRLAPVLRLTAPDGRRADLDLTPCTAGRTVFRGGQAVVTNHWWWRAMAAGAHRLTVVDLNGEPAGLRPTAVRWRLAAEAPPEPPRSALLAIGFGLLAVGFLVLVWRSRGETDGALAR
ncbi:MAG: hypothetical protein IT204_12070 [Fimbriimonadaceae bacterium]|nr:hypothetical protein [Fimbriimonadaceae bacterium]